MPAGGPSVGAIGAEAGEGVAPRRRCTWPSSPPSRPRRGPGRWSPGSDASTPGGSQPRRQTVSTGSTERTEDTGSTVDPREELAALRARLADVERRLDAL